MIKLNLESKQRVKDGVKFQTVRKGHKDQRIGIDELVFPDGESIKVLVTKVTFKMLASISDDDAKREGYKDHYELWDALTNIYGGMGPAEEMTIIQWELM